MLQRISISNKSFYSAKNPEKKNVSRFPEKYEAAQLFSILITTRRNDTWAANQHFRMIKDHVTHEAFN